MNKENIIFIFLILGGCAPNKFQIQEVIKKNPQIVFDVIEENPEQFIKSVNRAAQISQQNQYKRQVEARELELKEDLKEPKAPELSKQRMLYGEDSAKIVIVEYADFECPACRIAYETLKEFKDKHRGAVQFYYKNMPLNFHKMALPAAYYFEAILLRSRSKALRFYQYVFENQKHIAEMGFLDAAVQFSGADLKQVKKDLKSEKLKSIIEKDINEFKAYGFTGTPVVVLNGVALRGAPRLEDLERIVALTVK